MCTKQRSFEHWTIHSDLYKKTHSTNAGTLCSSQYIQGLEMRPKKVTYGDDITDYISFLWCSEGVERVGIVGIVRMISHSMLPLQFEVLSEDLGRIISGQSNHSVLDVLMNGVAVQNLQVQKQPWNACFQCYQRWEVLYSSCYPYKDEQQERQR